LPRESKRPQPAGDESKNKPEPLESFEQRDTGAGDKQQDDQHAVGAKVAEVIQVVGALPEGIDDQKCCKQKHATREQALHP
jgi:hypothetical protein